MEPKRILQAARRHGLDCESDGGDLRITIDKGEGRRIVVSAPRGLLEWSVELQGARGEILWSDGGEEGAEGTNEERLEDYEESVVSILELFVAYEPRLQGERLELRAQGGWLEWWKVEPPELPSFPITLHWGLQGASELFESEEELCEHLGTFHSIESAGEVEVRDVDSRPVWLRVEHGRLLVLQLALTAAPPLAMQESPGGGGPGGRGCLPLLLLAATPLGLVLAST